MTQATRRPARKRQYGSGGLSRLSDAKNGSPRWRLTVQTKLDEGEPKPLTRNFTGTEADAKRALKDFQRQIEDGRFADDSGLTFATAFERFMAEVRTSKSPTTSELYERILRTHALKPLGHLRMRDIQATHIRRVIASAVNSSRTAQRGGALAGKSRANLRSYLHALFNFSLKENIVPRNVVDQVATPQLDHVERVEVDVELANTIRNLSATNTELSPIIAVALGTGMRRGELCGMRWSDVDLASGRIDVRRAAKNGGRAGERKVIIGTTKTKRSNRFVIMPQFARLALKDHRIAQRERDLAIGLGNRGDGVYVFDMLGTKERSEYAAWKADERKHREILDPNELSRRFTRFVRSQRLPEGLRFHDLRHGFACLAHASGSDIKTVSEALGHSSIGVTANIYVRLFGSAALDDQATRLDELLSKAPAARVNG